MLWANEASQFRKKVCLKGKLIPTSSALRQYTTVVKAWEANPENKFMVEALKLVHSLPPCFSICNSPGSSLNCKGNIPFSIYPL